MSKVKLDLCEQLLQECYGEIVTSVGMFLLHSKSSTLGMIVQKTGLDPKPVRQALCSLVQQNIVSFYQGKSGAVEYISSPDAVVWRLRYPKYIQCAKTLFGDAAELLVEEMLLQGRSNLGEAVNKTVDKLNKSLESNGSAGSKGHPKISHSLIREKASTLVRARLIRRCESVIKDANGKVVSMDTEEPDLLFDPPRGCDYEPVTGAKRSLEESNEVAAKRRKLESGDSEVKEDMLSPSPPNSYWCVNVFQFHHHFRDEALVAAAAKFVDKEASEVMRAMLRISESKSEPTYHTSVDLSFTEIYNAIPKDKRMTSEHVDQYLKCLSENCCGFVTRCGESGGGMFQIHYFKAIEALCRSEIETVVLERFGSKALRMYRVLIAEKQIEQKQVEEKAMLPPKEAKELLYKMFAENFVTLTELSKAPDHAPARTFYFFHVNLLQVARMLLESCYKAAANVIVRRQKCLSENKRLLDKQERVEAIIASLDAEGVSDQKEEIEQMVTPSERKQLTKVGEASRVLETSELLLDHSIFIFETYINYTLNPPPPSKK